MNMLNKFNFYSQKVKADEKAKNENEKGEGRYQACDVFDFRGELSYKGGRER